MQKYFADAWFFIALFDRRDSHHRAALRLAGMIAPRNLTTHDAVLTEVLTYFADEGAQTRQRVVGGVRQTILESAVIAVERPLFLRALTRYEQRPDKEYSLVDCMSMVLMEERGIRHVLTNDHHFTQAGFTVVSE